MTNLANNIATAVRKVLGPSVEGDIKALLRLPFVSDALERSAEEVYLEQVARAKRLAEIGPRYEKLRADAGEAHTKAIKAEEAIKKKALEVTQARIEAFGVLNGLDAKERVETSAVREELLSASQPLVHAALVAVNNFSLNFIAIDLNEGKAAPPPKGVPKGFFEELTDVQAPGIALWHAAREQQDSTRQVLHDALYLALRTSEAAELVEGEFRSLNACLEKLHAAPAFSVDKDGNVAVDSPKTGTAVVKAGEVVA